MENGVYTREPQHSHEPMIVGVLIDSVDSFFNTRVIADLLEAAEENRLHLVFYFGGRLDIGKTSGSSSYAYSLPDPAILQALIILPHSVAPFNPQNSILLLLEQFPKIPVYSFFCELPDRYSVWSSETQALETMIRHLIEVHSYKRFALLCGPDSSESISRQRQDTICRILGEYTLSVDQELIFPGSFMTEDGKRAAGKILERTKEAPDVLVCLNDQMAIGAIKEFQNNGIAVPEDIAVVGFDDLKENSALPCTLSTINFPIWEMVTRMMERIASDISGKTSYIPEKLNIPARFMHRESCGCTSWFEKQTQKDSSFIPLDERHSSHGDLKRAAIMRRTLEEIIEECVSTNDTALFAEFIQQTIRSISRSGNITASFIDTLSTQWTITLLRYQDFNTQNLINALFVDACRLLIQTRMQTFDKIHTKDLGTLAFYQNCNDLVSQDLSVYEAIKGIGSNLSQLGISICLLVFCQPEAPETGELRLHYREGLLTEIPQENFIHFPIKQLIDTEIKSLHEHIGVLPVIHNNTVYGYLVLSITESHFDQFALIQKLVSQIIDSAMKNDKRSTHIQTLTQKNDALSRLSVVDEFTGLYNRRALYVTGRNMYQQSIDNGQTSCFIFLDMDGLKIINDTYGHKEGDIAILALASIMKKCFRENDLVVRYGGDEFVVLMVNIEEKTLHNALSRVSSQINTLNEKNKHPWKLSTSWGYVFINQGDTPRSFEKIIEESDANLYKQKRKKKNMPDSRRL